MVTSESNKAVGSEVKTAIGLMSGTSMDGVDASLIETDGERVTVGEATAFIPYDPGFRESLRTLLRSDPENVPTYDHLVGELTALNADAVEALLVNAQLNRSDIDVIGFHGQTVFHDPERHITIQLGDGQSLADRTGIPVVADLRQADVQAGGEGAPFAPLYHASLAGELARPLAVLNIGGVANVTWIGDGDVNEGENILAFDTGPGSALIDDWIISHDLGDYDAYGALAARGQVNETALAQLLSHPYFQRPPPKSLDRNDFDPSPVQGLSPEDGAATLTAFTAQTVAMALDHLPQAPVRWLVCGGGRNNETITGMLRQYLNAPVEPVEKVGWSGDHLEAEAFGFLAVRSLNGQALSLPTTTGVSRPMPGGCLYKPA